MSDPLKLLRDYASGDTQLRRIDQVCDIVLNLDFFSVFGFA